MKSPLHPSEYQNHWESSLRSQLAAYGSLIIAVAVAVTSVQVEGHRLRTGLIMAAMFGVSVSRIAVANQVDKSRILQDIIDVSDAQRQQRFYEAMKPGAGGGPLVSDNPMPILKRALDFPVVSLHGPQGSGKTTLAQWLATAIDSRRIVLDPHYLRGDWPDCEVIGGGADYEAIEQALIEAMRINKERYQERKRGVSEFERITYIVEELTSWEGAVPSTSKFLRKSLSDFRKANQKLLKISHGRTNIAQGGAAGTATMRKEGEVEIYLPRAGLARVTFPGEEPIEFELPKLLAGTPRAVEPIEGTPEPVDSPPPEQIETKLPENTEQAIAQILEVMESNGGRVPSAFLKDVLGMQGRNYAGAKKLIELLFTDQSET